MPNRIAVSTIQASTVDILNTIRANASPEYYDSVPEVQTASDIPRVGEVLFGYPALANQFLSALMTRIALVRIKSATFNNKFAQLKKGYLEYGESVEEIFVEIAKVQRFDPEKAPARQMKRTLPDVRTAFHAKNWEVQYPITVSRQMLRTAFQSEAGVRDLVERIVSSVYTAAEYDEWLLFKYLIIKAIANGKVKAIGIGDGDIISAAVTYRGTSNLLTFLSPDYNDAGVYTATPKNKQYILMDSMYNAQFDVEVLSRAFNMEKADFMGRLILMDSLATFDNTRWAQIRAECDGVEEVTADELNLLSGVKAILLDEDWFQVYDNLIEMADAYVGSGMYWNYWLNVFKTVSTSPFANAVVFALGNGNVVPESITATVLSVSKTDNATVVTLDTDVAGVKFIQNEDATEKGVAVHPFGAVVFPAGVENVDLCATACGHTYTKAQFSSEVTTGTHVVMAKG